MLSVHLLELGPPENELTPFFPKGSCPPYTVGEGMIAHALDQDDLR
jgi:hypothetical protein